MSKLTLLPLQEVGVSFLTHRRHTLLGDKPGVGKTIEVIGAMNILRPKKVLVICPATVKHHWRNKIQEFAHQDFSIQIIDTKKDILKHCDITIINYDLVKAHAQELLKIKYSIVVCDESHKLKNPEAIRTQVILGEKLEGGILGQGHYKMLLTGTPILNRPIDLYTSIKSLHPYLLGKRQAFSSFGTRYCGAYMSTFGIVYGKPSKARMEELTEMLRTFMISRDRADNGMPINIQEIPIPQNAEMLRIQKEEQQTLEAVQIRLDKDPEKVSKYAQLGIKSGTWKKTAIAKMPFCVDYIKDVLESIDKLVIFGYHHDVMDILMDKLKAYNPVALSGRTSSKDREKNIETFRNDPKCRLFIGQIEAAGCGLDGLQYVCADSIFVEISYLPGDVVQAMKRLDREGQTKQVNCTFLLVDNSIEYDMLDSIKEKAKIEKTIIRVEK